MAEPARRARLRWAILLGLLTPLAGTLRAQVPDSVRTDTVAVRPDSAARADTSARRTPQDTSATAILLRSEEDAKVLLAPFPGTVRDPLLPALSRIVLPRDSIDYVNAESVGDLLATIDGVFLWRGGWIGRAEAVNYGGRGATSVEYLIDGVPYVAMGRDSLAIDPSLFPLSMLERIEIDRLPGMLRVNLMLRHHGLLAPRTRVGIARGDFDQARYEGLFEKRFRNGFGIGLAAEFLVNPRTGREANHSSGWLQADYIPSPRFGVQARYLLQATDRSAELSRVGSDTLTRSLVNDRNDLTLRAFFRDREGGLGRRLDVLASRTRATWDSVGADRWQGGLIASQRGADYSAVLSALYGSRWTRLDTRLNLGWSPTPAVTVGGEGSYQTFDGDRSAMSAVARVGVVLPYGLRATGSWRIGDVVTRPNVLADSAQSISDRDATVAWESRWLGVRAGYTRLASFQPVGYWQFAVVDTIGAAEPTEWLMVGGRVAVRPWLTVAGWYREPTGRRAPEGAPPGNGFVEAAIRSKFLRTFPSGIFDLKMAVSMESWGTGVLGRGPTGEPVGIDGATFMRAQVQLQFMSFIVYLDRFNILNSPQATLPGITIPRNAQTFGVRWTFLN